MQSFEDQMRAGGAPAIQLASRFFMGHDPMHLALRGIAEKLDELEIEYAVVGGMALVAHGYDRTTLDVDILIGPTGLDALRASREGRRYRPLFSGSRNLRDTRTGVQIKFVLTGAYPGDGKPKAVAFPPPADVSVDIDGIR